MTAPGSEFDGVGQKIPRYLLKSVIITEDRASGGINQFSQPDPFGVGCRAYRLDSGLDYMREIHKMLQVKPDLAGDYVPPISSRSAISWFCARAFSFNGFQRSLDAFRLHRTLQDELGPSKNRVKWRPEFMRQGCEEFVLEVASPLGFGTGYSSLSQKSLSFFVRAFYCIDINTGAYPHRNITVGVALGLFRVKCQR